MPRPFVHGAFDVLGFCMGIVSITMGYRVERYIMCVNASAITIIQEFTSEESDIGPFVLNEDL